MVNPSEQRPHTLFFLRCVFQNLSLLWDSNWKVPKAFLLNILENPTKDWREHEGGVCPNTPAAADNQYTVIETCPSHYRQHVLWPWKAALSGFAKLLRKPAVTNDEVQCLPVRPSAWTSLKNNGIFLFLHPLTQEPIECPHAQRSHLSADSHGFAVNAKA